MRVAVCIDKMGGIAFGGKRLSRDGVVNEKLLSLLHEGEFLYMNSYSAKIFNPSPAIICSETFLQEANTNDICFVEAQPIDSAMIDELILIEWNRQYPADTFFTFDKKEFKKITGENIEGSSHKKITITIFRRLAK